MSKKALQANFRSRARVIDLLGREQIADAPTAIGELLKNSLDAAARNAWLTFDSEKRLLTVRDDGLGMRTADILEKWLVLATESKFDKSHPDSTWKKHADEQQREWLSTGKSFGEKGIGRLSVGAIGHGTLLWSVWGKGRSLQATMCFVHWHLFRHPTKLFDEIPIPYQSFSKGEDVSADSIISNFCSSVQESGILKDRNWDSNLRMELKADIQGDASAGTPSLQDCFRDLNFDWEAGTSFYIFNTSPTVGDLFQTREDSRGMGDDPSPDKLKAYNTFPAFWNPFNDKKKRKFTIHLSKDGSDLNSPNQDFWSPDDFKSADHHIKIKVSEDGFAKGELKNLGDKEAIKYQRQLTKLPRYHHSPGEFLIEVGYIKGDKTESMLSADDHHEYDTKLIQAGGFYVYVDDVRIQPYGSAAEDFIGFEERRNLNAGRYYFARRRMFGGVFLTSDNNSSLKEKAGREGFMVNGASRGLRYWIREVFLDLADSYYGSKSEAGKKRRERKKKSASKSKERLDNLRKEYLRDIKLYVHELLNFEREIKPLVQAARDALKTEQNGTPGMGLPACRRTINSVNEALERLERFPREPDQGIVLEGDELEAVDAYLSKLHQQTSNLTREVTRLGSQYQKLTSRAFAKEERVREVTDRIAAADEDVRTVISELIEPILENVERLSSELDEFANNEVSRLIQLREDALQGKTIRNIADDESGELTKILEISLAQQRRELRDVTSRRIARIQDDVAHLTDGTSSAFIAQDHADEIIRLRDQVGQLVEAAQLGLVLESATHEYEGQLATIRHTLNTLTKRLSGEEKIDIQTVSDSFEIIDERLRLFDPLLRRKTTATQTVTGQEIKEFILRRFVREELKEEVFIFSNELLKTEWCFVKRPIFLGAIHNLVLNSTYWSKQGIDDAKIKLHILGDSLIVSDNGPGVPTRDANRIFDAGFSRKPYGRGIGLYVAKESLRGIGFQLILLEEQALGGLSGANFEIINEKGNDN